MKLWLSEKPSMGRDIAKVLGVVRDNKTHIETRDGIVTWAIGHLFELDNPDKYDTKYKMWNFVDLPIIPSEFKVHAKSETKDQLAVVRDLVKQASEVVIATDAGREGEMIGREILDYYKFRGPVSRLWLHSLDRRSIEKGLASIKAGSETLPFHHAALGRSRADWLVGMNMTRATTIKFGGRGKVMNIGRVQTPTFALVVEREREIKNFRPEDYFNVTAMAVGDGNQVVLTHAPSENNRIKDRAEAQRICSLVDGKNGALSVETSRKRTAPPKLFDLTAMQVHANQQWNWPSDKTLKVMQSLYETHKYTTYPRVACTFLPEEMIPQSGVIIDNVVEAFGVVLPDGFKPLVRNTVFNTEKVEEHHAIIPTQESPDLSKLNPDELKAYTAVAMSYLAIFYPDYEYDETVIKTEIEGYEFSTKGKVPVKQGWRDLLGTLEKKDELPAMSNGETVNMQDVKVEAKQTTPPAYYNEASLLKDMENLAKRITNPKHKALLKDRQAGLGTPATRAAILKGLKDAEFLKVSGKRISSTPKSQELYDVLSANMPSLIDPAETAVWEFTLAQVETGEITMDQFVEGVAESIRNHLRVLNGFENSAQPERKDSSYTSFHPDHVGVAIQEDGKAWYCPGYGRMPKVIASRPMKFEELKRLIEEGELLALGGFRSKANKLFSAGLKYTGTNKEYNSIAYEWVFEEREAPKPVGNGKGVPTQKYGNLVDCGEFWMLSKLNCRVYKRLSGKEFTEEEILQILNGENGVDCQFISPKTNKPYRAVARFNPNAKPFPKMELVFENAGPKAGGSGYSKSSGYNKPFKSRGKSARY